MPSRHEAIILALESALAAFPGEVMRVEILPQHCPPAGLLNIVPGDPAEQGEKLGTGHREFRRDVELELVVQGADAAALNAAMDAALVSVAGLLGDVTLGGLVDYLRLSAPADADDLPIEGAAALKGAVLPIELYYETTENPMEIQT